MLQTHSPLLQKCIEDLVELGRLSSLWNTPKHLGLCYVGTHNPKKMRPLEVLKDESLSNA